MARFDVLNRNLGTENESPVVSVIIANFNGEKFLERCLYSLFAEAEVFEVIVVENGSIDNSLNLLKEKFSQETRLKVIALEKNQGAARARNIGAKEARGQYFFFLDNDTKIKEGWFKPFLEFFKNYPRAGLAQAKLLKMGTNQFDSAGDLITPFGFLAERARSAQDQGQFDKVEKIFALKSAAMLARRDVFEKLGGFDEDFQLFWEETDLAWRCWLSGFEVLFYPEITVWHAYQTPEKPKEAYAKSKVVYRGCKNMLSSQIKNLGTRKLFFILPASIFSWLILAVLFFLKLDFKKSFAAFQGFFWNLFNLPLNLKKRRIIQSQRKISDKELFSLVSVKKNASYYFGKALAYLTNKPF